MDFYHSWIYQKVINTEWFMWIIVCVVLGINIISPLIVWYFITGKKMVKKYIAHKKQNQQPETGNAT
ncbi:hypothetical protein A8990_12069 [Paenibacillus taihuensis]|uniref:Uncharacterized protein n=1 Tax=Paenibacillus taihuensis TaxID=1156355 RepID=A0A3D9RMA1_9BACL|nr:hypothetical protein [Paenibacillus taihuensis]REE81023.1 hypothetical protein A8990_12069 [Paenibacillus taihuensis]